MNSRREIDNHIGAGRIDQARELATAAVEECCDSSISASVDCISAIVDLSKVATAHKDHLEYLHLVHRARDLTLQLLGHDHPDTVFADLCLCNAYIGLDDFKTAQQHAAHALSEINRLQIQGTELHAHVLARTSTLALKLGCPQDAEAPAIKAVAVHRKLHQMPWPQGLQILAEAYTANGKHSLAASVLRKRQQHLDLEADLSARLQ